jgi:LmbE family N-acetylglucosaminyl deacetylase
MAERPDCEVVTVFGGYPENPQKVVTDYDTKCGFKNAHDAVSERRRENDAATALLRATSINLDFPDGQYGIEVTERQIVEVLQRIVDGHDYDMILAPVGLGHPDHIKVSNAVAQLETTTQILLWEDLPLRVVEPEIVPYRLAGLRLGYRPYRTIHVKENMADKIRALLCYKSQIGTGILDPYLMYVPERFYEL